MDSCLTQVVEVPVQDVFPPNDVRDLIATPVDTNTLSLTWTAPGEDLDSGTGVVNYIITTKYLTEINDIIIYNE